MNSVNHTEEFYIHSAGSQLLSVLHGFLLAVTAGLGFLTWTVVRLTYCLHDLTDVLVASVVVAACLFGSASCLLHLVLTAEAGLWWYGRELCVLAHVLDVCFQTGAAWCTALAVCDLSLWVRYGPVYSRVRVKYGRWYVPTVWLVSASLGTVAILTSNGAFYTNTNLSDAWTCVYNEATKSTTLITIFMSFLLPYIVAMALLTTTTRILRPVALPSERTDGERKGDSKADGSRDQPSELTVLRETSDASSKMVQTPGYERSISEPDVKTLSLCSNTESVDGRKRSLSKRHILHVRGPSHLDGDIDSDLPIRQAVSMTRLDTAVLESQTRLLEWLPSVEQPKSLPKLDLPCQLNLPRLEQALSMSTSLSQPPIKRQSTVRKIEVSQVSGTKKADVMPVKNPAPARAAADEREQRPARFLYSRQDMSKDADNWPTIFLTADMLHGQSITQSHESVDEGCRHSPQQGTYTRQCQPGAGGPRNARNHPPTQGGLSTTKTLSSTGSMVPDSGDSSCERTEANKTLIRLWLLVVTQLLLLMPHYIIICTVSLGASSNVHFSTYASVELVARLSLPLATSLFFYATTAFRRALYDVIRCRDPNLDHRGGTGKATAPLTEMNHTCVLFNCGPNANKVRQQES